jgi:hypothetical protein
MPPIPHFFQIQTMSSHYIAVISLGKAKNIAVIMIRLHRPTIITKVYQML